MIESFVSRMSDLSGTTHYTNHCLRVTGATTLRRCNYSVEEIMAITGHNTDGGLKKYFRALDTRFIRMGYSLALSLQNTQRIPAANVQITDPNSDAIAIDYPTPSKVARTANQYPTAALGAPVNPEQLAIDYPAPPVSVANQYPSAAPVNPQPVAVNYPAPPVSVANQYPSAALGAPVNENAVISANNEEFDFDIANLLKYVMEADGDLELMSQRTTATAEKSITQQHMIAQKSPKNEFNIKGNVVIHIHKH